MESALYGIYASTYHEVFSINFICCVKRLVRNDIILAPVVQKVDSAIHWINLYPVVNNTTGSLVRIRLDSDLSGG